MTALDSLADESCFSLVSLPNEWTDELAAFAYRLLKPGAHGAVGAGSSMRSHHLAWLLESAGFEVRDVLLVMSSSGATDWLLIRRPIEGTVASNVMKHGTGALNIDAGRIVTGGRPAREIDPKPEANGAVFAGRQNAGSGFDGGSRAVGETTVGRWPANLALVHSAGCKRIGTKRVRVNGPDASQVGLGKGAELTEGHGICHGVGGKISTAYADADGKEAVSAWECVARCPVRLLDEQNGQQVSGIAYEPQGKQMARSIFGATGTLGRTLGYGDSGGASRFFKCASSEADLFRWIVRIVCPPGILLDPFASNEVAVAATIEGVPLAIPISVSIPEPEAIERGAEPVASVPRAEQLGFDL